MLARYYCPVDFLGSRMVSEKDIQMSIKETRIVKKSGKMILSDGGAWAIVKGNPFSARGIRIIRQRREAKKVNLPSTLTQQEWELTLQLFHNKCVYCGKPWEHQDHFIPISKGGGYEFGNIVPACAFCNIGKRDKLPEIFCGKAKADEILSVFMTH